MGIKTLQPATVRSIGASQVLTDPAAVVKELLDNALDARATSIAIEISTNTVDSIQVRDNGHGIPPEDRQLIARPHCTSKITDEADLKSLCGTRLGFRGEALASLAEMSGSLTISTRVEGEPVAVAMSIDRQGEVTGQTRASLPVGTTVKATDFMAAHPVRRQVALKNADKCLARIKYLLKLYAFARPHVRLGSRVLKSKGDSVNWTFAPKANGSVEDAALKIVGAACVSQCDWTILQHDGFTLTALVPRIGADVSKISGLASFISIDKRPLSTDRSTAKRLMKMFRETLKQADARFEGVKDVFFRVDITCPPGTYDVNVEPAKDDVVFEDSAIVFEAARRLFGSVYPLPENTVSADEHAEHSVSLLGSSDSCENEIDSAINSSPSMLSKKQSHLRLVTDEIIQDLTRGSPHAVQQVIPNSGGFRANVRNRRNEDLDMLDTPLEDPHVDNDAEDLHRAQKDVNIFNPWVIAKLNAPISWRRPLNEQADVQLSEGLTREKYEEPRSSNLGSASAVGLPTPRSSSPLTTFGEHEALRRKPRTLPFSSPQALLDTPFSTNQDFDATPETSDGLTTFLPVNNTAGTPLHMIPDFSARTLTRRPKRLHQTKLDNSLPTSGKDAHQREKVWFDHLEDLQTGSQSGRKKRQSHKPFMGLNLVNRADLESHSNDPRPLSPPRHNRDIREFIGSDGRGSNGSATLAEEENRAESFVEVNMPARKRRLVVEAQALQEMSNNAVGQFIGGLEDGPRANSNSQTGLDAIHGQPRRQGSSQLRLETMSPGQGSQNLVMRLRVTPAELARMVQESNAHMNSCFRESVAGAFRGYERIPGPAELKAMAARLYELLGAQQPDAEIILDLEQAVCRAFAAHVEHMANL